MTSQSKIKGKQEGLMYPDNLKPLRLKINLNVKVSSEAGLQQKGDPIYNRLYFIQPNYINSNNSFS